MHYRQLQTLLAIICRRIEVSKILKLQPLRLPRLADNVGALWPTNNNSYMHAC